MNGIVLLEPGRVLKWAELLSSITALSLDSAIYITSILTQFSVSLIVKIVFYLYN